MENNRIATPPPANHAQGVRGKPAAHAPAGAATEEPGAAGSFLALLGALGDSTAPEDALLPDAAPVVQPALQADPRLLGQPEVQTDAVLPTGGLPEMGASLQAWQGPSGLQHSVVSERGEALSEMGASLQVWQEPSGLQHSALPERGNGAATLSLAEVAQQAGLVGAELLGQGSLVAQTAKMDAAAPLQALPGQGSALAGYQRAFARLQGVLSQGGAQGPAGAARMQAGSPEPAGRQQEASVSMAVTAAVAAAADRLEGAGLPARVAAEPAFTALQAQWLAPAQAAVRSADPPSSREAGASAHALGGTPHAGPEGPRAESEGTAFDPAAAAAEETATEQAAYWVSENLQSAEMTVTHDGMPLEVRVSLSGNEAHVDFGSDEHQTRELLDAGQQQLRDMLGQEGLVLSGVSVGGSGARSASGDGSAPPRGRPSGRMAVQAAGGEAAVAPGRPSVLTERAVDVFV